MPRVTGIDVRFLVARIVAMRLAADSGHADSNAAPVRS